MRPFDSASTPLLAKTDFRSTASTRYKLPSTSELRTSSIAPLLSTQPGTLSAVRIRPNYTKLPSLGHKRYLSHSTGHRIDKVEGQVLQMMGSLASLNHQLRELKHEVQSKKGELMGGFQHNKSQLEGIVANLNSTVCETRSFFANRNRQMGASLDLLSAQSAAMKERLWEVGQRVSHLQSAIGVYTGGDKYVI